MLIMIRIALVIERLERLLDFILRYVIMKNFIDFSYLFICQVYFTKSVATR